MNTDRYIRFFSRFAIFAILAFALATPSFAANSPARFTPRKTSAPISVVANSNGDSALVNLPPLNSEVAAASTKLVELDAVNALLFALEQNAIRNEMYSMLAPYDIVWTSYYRGAAKNARDSVALMKAAIAEMTVYVKGNDVQSEDVINRRAAVVALNGAANITILQGKVGALESKLAAIRAQTFQDAAAVVERVGR